ncbi:TPA: sugar ABC transporter ATP-binding protein [Streptococcus equi subsp. zooepidemicus]|uniref:Ribose transport ATP-binding protein RbsA n=1 Tax=Streptococcus equi subsp. zooepidemicus (strain MGCS10565) TaxID=552526 RepID=B4U1H6_STREM|nr:sugar ABC transporter ATP-binding protein [Streptococcus equi]VED85048.1 ribose import ATP-binding protein RbsA [Streptococcus equi subsp. equi]ACG61843.1 ribose transport ATP-binding protein RbsA [Streptococcus equi subsp. zooepidemicus MGCS10565]MCD3375430.1 sugar ABC transporter ATP-binding protein [Streptococcus equi subsp. zooepidemicus]MCD3390438.1 sugar ABC transporter ATP-binding protein [Streptococcus equi subsp. zooepidemicus]MCD3455395.1 sugar ABC transporter ATP-binding protein 
MKIEMTAISKSFGTNKVLEKIDLVLHSGQVHALMGENGAGKSTLMNILTGLFPASSGTIVIDGVEKQFSNPQEAEAFGISFIHQEMNTWPDMTVLDNLFLGREIKGTFGLLDQKAMKEKAKRAFDRLGISIPLDLPIGSLSVGQQQMIEIAKSLLSEVSLLVMDEPTAALTDRETESLFQMIASLKKAGVGIVYISHRMEEIFRVTDLITVMRDGIVVDTKPTAETNPAELVKKMVGRDIDDYYPAKAAELGELVFEVENLSGECFKDISFQVRRGEILGFSGLMGAGRTEVMRAIFGLDKRTAGRIRLNGQDIQVTNPVQAIRAGIGFLTEDRKEEGLILDFSIKDNMTLPSHKDFSKNGFFDDKTSRDFVQKMIDRLRIKSGRPEMVVGNLSGGNQQKVVLAKWIGIAPKVLILDEPTRGVDVGAKREIYQLMNELAERGVPILLVSSDLPEVLGVSDRIVVMHEGRITGELSRGEATQEKVMQLATGGK